MQIVFELWPSVAQMARDLGEKDVTVRAWKARGSIPAGQDVKLVKAASELGKALTYEHLARLRAGDSDVVIPNADCNVTDQKK
ncbi:MAG: hypothetical protein GYB53_21430 [Rhodobacteraceae bacterium]|nr:hypothetical protein [Paracoccaceae bacterium]MBR9823051.1 hypothetical protein [Paracoccaceae bacterium]